MSGAWTRERAAWTFILAYYLPRAAMLHLFWEAAQLPLYTLWTEAEPREIVFAVVHCTLGDLLINAAALLAALIASRSGACRNWRWGRIGVLSVTFGAGYTAFSEWINTAWLGSWAYAAAMPTLELFGVQFGLSPLAQWLLVPPLALAWSYRTMLTGALTDAHVKRRA